MREGLKLIRPCAAIVGIFPLHRRGHRRRFDYELRKWEEAGLQLESFKSMVLEERNNVDEERVRWEATRTAVAADRLRWEEIQVRMWLGLWAD